MNSTNIYNEDYIPTKAEWDSLSKQEQEELIVSVKQDIFDEESFLWFYESRDNKEFFESEIIDTKNNIVRFTEKLNYLNGLAKQNEENL